MKKNNNILVYLVAVLALSVIFYYTFFSDSKTKVKKYNWYKTFTDGEQQPYDFGLLKKLIKQRTDHSFDIVTSKLSTTLRDVETKDSVTYIFIGEYCFYNKEEINALLEFAARGKQVMLIAEQFPDTLLTALQEFGKPFKIQSIRDNHVNVHFNNSSSKYDHYPFNYRYFEKDMKEPVNWNYISEEGQLDYYYGSDYSRYLRLSTFGNKVNFAKFKLGNGYIFLHTNPLMFTNYFLSKDTGFSHAGHVFSEIETKNVIYDIAAREFKEDGEKTIRKSDTPLSYILKQKALKWAWYLLITAVILFFLFKAKREQRIIPVLEQKRNTSLNFIETISSLYFNFSDHKKMAEIKMNLFTIFIRNRLGISTIEINEAVLLQISTKAKVPLHDTSIIFDHFERVIKQRKQIEGKDLIKLNTCIETFYHFYNAKK